MERRYTTLENLEESLKKLVPELNECRLEVVISEDNARIVGITTEELDERNLRNYVDNVCSIKWEYDEDSPFGRANTPGPITMTVHFHENEIENEFEFLSSGGNWTNLGQLSRNLGEIERVFDEEFDLPTFDFAEINSASMSGGFFDGLADREFKYEQIYKVKDFE